MNAQFEIGAAVEFTGSRARTHGKVHRGVVVSVRRASGGRSRYVVQIDGVSRTEKGATMSVPEKMLRPSSAPISAETKKELAAAGREHLEKRAESREKRAEKLGALLGPVTDEYRVGQTVEAYGHFGWHAATVVRVDREKGKVTVTNYKADLVDAFGPLPNGRRVTRTITVLADRVRLPRGGAR